MAWHAKDKAGKWLLDHQAGVLLRLAGVRGVRAWRTRQAETVQPGQLPDGLLEVNVTGRAKPVLVLMELASRPERRLVHQLRRGMELVELDRGELPEPAAVVLQPHGRYELPSTMTIRSALGLGTLTVGYQVVRPWELAAAELLALGDVGALPWVPLTRFDEPPAELFRELRERIDRQAPPGQHEQLLAATRIMAGMKYNDPGLLRILFGGTTMIKWTDFPDIKEALDERAATVRRESVVQILQTRFRRVPKVVLRKLESITDPERLAQLVPLAVTCADLASFRAELTAKGGG